MPTTKRIVGNSMVRMPMGLPNAVINPICQRIARPTTTMGTITPSRLRKPIQRNTASRRMEAVRKKTISFTMVMM